jgi:DnaJ family protein B protein 4
MPGGFNFGGMPGGGGGGRTFHFSTGGGGPDGFSFSNADDIFREFAKGSTGGGRGGFDDDDIFSMLNGGMGGGGFRRPKGASQQKKRAPTPEPTVIEKDLPVTLEEIFNGVTKKVTTRSKTFDSSGKLNAREVILEAKIKPGLRSGSKIKYKNFGDSEEGGRQDMHLIVKEVCDTHVLTSERNIRTDHL